MRATLLLPVACLALIAGPAVAQQAAPQPGSAETAPAPAPAPAPPDPRQGMGMPHEMGMGMHEHRGMFQAPGLRIRVGGISLDLRCAVGDTTEACAQAALGIVDHLSQMTQGGDGQGDNADQGSNDDSGGDDDGSGDQ